MHVLTRVKHGIKQLFQECLSSDDLFIEVQIIVVHQVYAHNRKFSKCDFLVLFHLFEALHINICFLLEYPFLGTRYKVT